MKEYICNTCGKEFDVPKLMGQEESETYCCPYCKNDDYTIIEPVND